MHEIAEVLVVAHQEPLPTYGMQYHSASTLTLKIRP